MAKNRSEDMIGYLPLCTVVYSCERNLGRLSEIPVKLFFRVHATLCMTLRDSTA